MPKPKRYLITVACEQGCSRDQRFVHTRHATVSTEYPHHAEQLALDLAAQHGRAMVAKHTTNTVGPCAVVSVQPVRHRKRKSASVTKGHTSVNHNHVAIAYAKWLAARDGVRLPKDVPATVTYGYVSIPGRKSPQGRVCAVHFGLITINIPNWDWVPADPVETIEPEVLERLAA